MLYSSPVQKLINAQLPVFIKLYGVNVKVYSPKDSHESAAQNMHANIEYMEEPLFSEKMLIPSLLVKRSENMYSMFDFVEGEHFVWTEKMLPPYSKLILDESRELSSFIVNGFQQTEDVNFGGIYNRFALIPSADLLNRQPLINKLGTIITEEEALALDREFEQAIDGNITPDTKESIPVPTIGFGRL